MASETNSAKIHVNIIGVPFSGECLKQVNIAEGNWYSGLSSGPIVWICRDTSRVRRCRFCKRTGVKFSKIAHALPFFTGNRVLRNWQECDDCNALFGRYENSLANFVRLPNLVSGVKGRRSSHKIAGKDWKIEKTGDKIELECMADESVFSLDTSAGLVRFGILTEKFKPLDIYRSLLKCAISICPIDKLQVLEPARQWLQEASFKNAIDITCANMCIVAQSSRIPRHPFASIWFKKDKETDGPYCIFSLTFGHQTFFIYPPCPNHETAFDCLQEMRVPVIVFPWLGNDFILRYSANSLTCSDSIAQDSIATFSFVPEDLILSSFSDGVFHPEPVHRMTGAGDSA